MKRSEINQILLQAKEFMTGKTIYAASLGILETG